MFDRTSFQGEQKFMTKTGAILTYPNRRRYLECYIHQSVIKGLILKPRAGMAAQASRFSISTNFFSIRSLRALSCGSIRCTVGEGNMAVAVLHRHAFEECASDCFKPLGVGRRADSWILAESVRHLLGTRPVETNTVGQYRSS